MPQHLAASVAPVSPLKISCARANKFYANNRARVATTRALDDLDIEIAAEQDISIADPIYIRE